MSDDLGIDLGDLPEIPDEQAAGADIADSFDYDIAFKFAFVGVGQAGGRIAATFAEIGYRRVCAINTTIADLAELKLPDESKLDIGDASGAAKDPATARAIAADKGHDFHDLFQRCWGDSVDYAFVCLGAAGGTGAGAYPKVAESAKAYMEEHKHPPKVGAIVALPKDTEGQQPSKNAIQTVRSLTSAGLSPVIIIDNQKIATLFNPTVSQQHARENKSTAQLLHAFNRLAGKETDLTTFDRADFGKLLDSGVIAFASATATKWDSPADVSTPVRDQLKKNVLATVDLSGGNVAGIISVLHGKAQEEVKTSDLDHAVQMLTRILAKGSTVYDGVYRGAGSGADDIKMLVMIGSLPWPRQRLEELAINAGESKDAIAEFLGV